MFRNSLLLLLLFSVSVCAQNVSVLTTTGTQTVSHKTISGADNTLSNIAPSSITSGTLTVGHILVSHTNNTTDIYAISSNTDAARGTALTTAVTAMITGDKLALGPGVYQVAAPLYLPSDYSQVKGAGIGSTVIKLADQGSSATGGDVIRNTAWRTGVSISDLSLDCNLAAQSGTNYKTGAVYLLGRDLRLSRLKAFGYGTKGTSVENFAFFIGTANQTGDNYVIEDCVLGAAAAVHHTSGVNAFNIVGSDNGGAQTDGTSAGAYWIRNAEVKGCSIEDVTCSTSGTSSGQPTYVHGVGVGKCVGAWIHHNHFNNVYGGNGCGMIYGDEVPFQDILIEHNIGVGVDSLVFYGPALANTKGVRIENNFADITTPSLGGFPAIYIAGLSGSNTRDVDIKSNTIVSTDSGSTGIRVAYCDSAHITGNHFRLATPANDIAQTSNTNSVLLLNFNGDGSEFSGDTIAVSSGTSSAPGLTITVSGTTLTLSGTATNSNYLTSAVTAITAPSALFTTPVTVTGGTGALAFKSSFTANQIVYTSATNNLGFLPLGSNLAITSGTLNVATQIKQPAGSAGAPSYSFSGDPTSGVYQLNGGGGLALSAAGARFLYSDGSGFVAGLPIQSVYGSVSAPGFTFQDDLGTGIYHGGGAGTASGITAFSSLGVKIMQTGTDGVTVGTGGTPFTVLKTGTAQLVPSGGASTVTVVDSAVTTATRIFAQDNTTGSLTNVGVISIVVSSGSFTATSTNILDASPFSYLIIK